MNRKLPSIVLAMFFALLVSYCFSATIACANEAAALLASAEIKAAVDKSLPLLVAGAKGSLEQRKQCFTCHNQGLPIFALTTAKTRGYSIDEEHLQAQLKHTAAFLEKNKARYLEGKGQGGQADMAGYALWTLSSGAWPSDEVTTAVAEYFLLFQKDSDHWRSVSNRPPSEASPFTATYVSLYGLQAYGTTEQQPRIAARRDQVREWLLQTEAKDTEDHVFRLRALALVDAPAKEVTRAQTALLKLQRDDGGWAQLADLASDPYATGSALVALHESANLSTSDEAYQRGLRFLLKEQQSDGSWHVKSRSKPFQPYFESGYPHGKDQFISIAAGGWATIALLLALPAVEPPEPEFDLVIRGGRIVDGTGNPWYTGDVALREQKIVAIARSLAGKGKREIAAQGLVVAPGFIDMHSHSDTLLLEDGHAQSKIRQGVTTEVLGEGSSSGPYLGKLDPLKVKVGGEERSCRTLADYFRALEEGQTAVNVASYVGLDNVWQSMMGKSFDRPTPEQFAEMKQLLGHAMDDGAVGVSTMLAMPPGSLAKTDDLIDLAKVVAAKGGIYSTHNRNEGTEVFAAIKEAIAIGEGAKIPVDIIHLKIADQEYWGRMKEIVQLIDEARARGVNVQANVYPYTRGNNNLASIIPPWAHEGGRAQLLARLKSDKDRERLKREINSGLPGWYNHFTAVGGDWGRMLISGGGAYQGLTMNRVQAMKAEGKTPPPEPLDILFDLLIEEGGSIPTVYAHHTEADMNLALAQPWCSIGSDGSAYSTAGPLRRGNPHPRNFGTFPRVLGVYVREAKLLTLEDAVRKMTSLNAAKIGLRERGELKAGYFADLTLFAADRVLDKSTYTEPFAYNEGIEYVIVNGQVVLDRGQHTGAMPGKVLRHVP
ncbi:D-aminoacylase [Anatilimnocola aggregata]|uniref:D-aminoacylase n=1 Tax=Anatilimnocola aggregata TaxID=2528021 RepID=A0A517Y806_9BACT|nr:amidohydrolase family protein [Anatilimnocola aggregata]QDU26345.1 D-aminoacylase [Anatilimnocola aggregata]